MNLNVSLKMQTLFTYSIIDGTCTDMFAVRIVIDVCLDPDDQDHNGVNFGFYLESEDCSFIKEWESDEYLNKFVDGLEEMLKSGGSYSFVISNACDGSINFMVLDDYIEYSIELDHFISLNSTLKLKDIATPKDEFIRFVKSLRQLVSDRDMIYQQNSMISTNKT